MKDNRVENISYIVRHGNEYVNQGRERERETRGPQMNSRINQPPIMSQQLPTYKLDEFYNIS